MWCRSVKFTLQCRMPACILPCSTQQTHAQEVFFCLDLLLDHPEGMERRDEWQHILLERFVWSWDVQGKSCWCVLEWFIALWSAEWWCRCRCYQKYKCQIFIHQRRWWGMEKLNNCHRCPTIFHFVLVETCSLFPISSSQTLLMSCEIWPSVLLCSKVTMI